MEGPEGVPATTSTSSTVLHSTMETNAYRWSKLKAAHLVNVLMRPKEPYTEKTIDEFWQNKHLVERLKSLTTTANNLSTMYTGKFCEKYPGQESLLTPHSLKQLISTNRKDGIKDLMSKKGPSMKENNLVVMTRYADMREKEMKDAQHHLGKALDDLSALTEEYGSTPVSNQGEVKYKEAIDKLIYIITISLKPLYMRSDDLSTQAVSAAARADELKKKLITKCLHCNWITEYIGAKSNERMYPFMKDTKKTRSNSAKNVAPDNLENLSQGIRTAKKGMLKKFHRTLYPLSYKVKKLSWFNKRKRKFDFDEIAGKLQLENVRKDIKTKGLELSDLLKKERELSDNLELDLYSPVTGQILITDSKTLMQSAQGSPNDSILASILKAGYVTKGDHEKKTYTRLPYRSLGVSLLGGGSGQRAIILSK